MPAATLHTSSHESNEQKYRRNQAAEGMAKYPKLDLSAPDWLDPVAQKEWTRVISYAEGTAISELDRTQLASHCILFATVKAAEEDIQKNGYFIEDEKGKQARNPYIGIRDSAIYKMKSVDTALGLTPQSRVRIELQRANSSEEAPKDEYEALLS